MSNVLLFHSNNSCKKALQCYIIRTSTAVSNIYVLQEIRNYSDQAWWLQWSVTPQSDVLWPHSVSSEIESCCAQMISCSLGMGYADGRVHFVDLLLSCKNETYHRKSTSASQWLNYNTRMFGQCLQSSDTTRYTTCDGVLWKWNSISAFKRTLGHTAG
jgi:hypothetical protein